jgi:O-antigen/teichoic acid export membrane protein
MFRSLKKDMREGRTLLLYGGIRILAYSFNFLIPIVLAVYFSAQTYGSFTLGMMVIYLFNATLVLPSGKPFVIYGHEEMFDSQKSNYAFTSRLILVVSATLMLAAVVVLFTPQIVQFTQLTATQTYFLLFVLMGKAFENLIGSLFLVLNKRTLEAAFLLLSACLLMLFLLGLYVLNALSLKYVFLIFFLAPATAFLFFFKQIEFKKILPLAFDKPTFFKITHFTKWMVFGGAAAYFLNWGDNFVLRYFVSVAEIGVYNLGYQFFKGTLMMMSILKIYFLPFISQNISNRAKISDFLQRKRPKLFAAGAFMIGLLFAAMPWIADFLFSAQYKDAVLIFRILCLGSLFSLYGLFYDPIFDSLKLYQYSQSIVVACVVINIALDFLLVGLVGYVGAAIATTTAYFLLALAKEILFRKYCRQKVLS